MAPVILALLLAQYPPELPPRQPAVSILALVVVPAPVRDLPAADSSQPVKVLWLFPSNIVASQAAADAFCADVLPWDNAVIANDPQNQTRYQLVGCRRLTYVAPNAMNTELSWVQSDATVAALRDSLHADMVKLFDRDGSSCGLAYIGASTYGKQYAFAVVNIDCAKSNYSSVHESGHNFGLVHDEPNAGQAGTSPDAYGFCDSAHGRRDPMVYPSPCGGNRVPYFGNPSNTTAFGYPFGDTTHNAARVLRTSMPIVANFYPPVSTAPVNHAR